METIAKKLWRFNSHLKNKWHHIIIQKKITLEIRVSYLQQYQKSGLRLIMKENNYDYSLWHDYKENFEYNDNHTQQALKATILLPTHQEKNKLKCTQWHFQQFRKLLLNEIDCLNKWNECATKVKWEKLINDYL